MSASAGDGTGPGAPSLDRSDDEVRLILQAHPRHLRLARLTAAGLAVDVGFDVRSIEDLRVAVDELAAALIDGVPSEGQLSLTYHIDDNQIVIDGEVDAEGASPPALHAVAQELLGIVADEYAMNQDAGRRTFRLVKRGRDVADLG